MSREGDAARALMQEIYLQELALSVYRIYLPRLRDPGGRAILETYLKGERFRTAQIETYLQRAGVVATPALRSLFRRAGALYGYLTASLGTRMMLRIILSASKRASRRACGALGDGSSPDLVFLSTLRARNEGDLLDALTQHLIDTRPRPQV